MNNMINATSYDSTTLNDERTWYIHQPEVDDPATNVVRSRRTICHQETILHNYLIKKTINWAQNRTG